MRKWQWIAVVTVALGSAGAYWYYTTRPIQPDPVPEDLNRITKLKDNGDAEESEVIEPLIVDRGPFKAPENPAPPADPGPMSRVVLEPGTQQPPRPDAGGVPRMPYADEEDDPRD